ncbi:MAG: 23S rRNA (guanosine(2251)-2'-O)-methyltransferase RlmB [Proteobacteria bacterium]|nr:23S rRNA (guanosine(2251)-2'-O)-methyltransferase RlmB [Pseudomonadota bacterium]MBI3505769.1 23S rRNA (guanosine(2251)-2'-O)-methyltransferase RlmB [Pseudomonadota bacterium]
MNKRKPRRVDAAPRPASGPTLSSPHQRTPGPPWLYGVHAVLAALANPRRRSHRLLLTSEARLSVASKLSALGGPAPEIVDRQTLDRILPAGVVHQGIALAADPLPETDLAGLLRTTGERAAVIVLDQVTDPHNVGAVLRSAAAFGASAVVLPERHAPAATGVLAKAASGALELVPLIHVVNLARAMEALKRGGFWCIGFEENAKERLDRTDFSGRVALVLGAEGTGLRRLTRDGCDLMVRLPTRPELASLNVSNAAAVALYEYARGRD